MRFLNDISNRYTGRTDFSDQYRRYRETLFWIVTELIRFDRNKTLLAISFNVLGGLLKAGALALLLYYANLMEHSAPVSVLGFSWDPGSETVFYAVLLMALVLLVSGALVVYFGNHINNDLAISFASHCSKTVLCSSGGRPARNPDPGRSKYHPGVKNDVTGIIGLVRGVKPVLQVSGPLSVLLYSTVVLLYLNSLVTLAVLVLALVSLWFQYRVNFQSVQNESALLESRRAGKQWLAGIFGDLVLTPRIYPTRAAWIDREYSHSVISDFLQRYYQRIIARPRSALVGDMLLAILLFLVVGYLGSQALAGRAGWASFFAYLLFLRVSLMAFRGLLVSITGFARHYPRVRRIFEFSRSLKAAAYPADIPRVIAARGKDRIGDRKKIRLNPGDPVCILSRVPLTRFNLYAFVDAIAGRDVEANNCLSAATACVARGFTALPGGSMNELMAIPVAASVQSVADRYHSIGLQNSRAIADRNIVLSDSDWRAMSRHSRACILMEQARQETAWLVLVDAAVLAESGAAYSRQWSTSLSDKCIAVVTEDVHALKELNCECVLLMAPDRSVSVAAAPWCLDNAAVIDAWFDRHTVQVEAEPDEEAFDDD